VSRPVHDPAPVDERGGVPRSPTSQNRSDTRRRYAYRESGLVLRPIADIQVDEPLTGKRSVIFVNRATQI
jgi:hypothetical protein